MVYLDPALVQTALGGTLPFAADPVLSRDRLPADAAAELWDIDAELDDLAATDLVAVVLRLLRRAAPTPRARAVPLAIDGLTRVRDLLLSAPADRPDMALMERIAGLDRWTLARQFRRAYGTSPSRFRMLRQLDLARERIRRGSGLADAAAAAGFADQSHMTRQFKRSYGLTPARWAALL